MRLFRFALAVLIVLGARHASAMFRAADLVVVPVAAALPGLNSSNWRSDLEILNVATDAIDVEIVLLASGGASNALWYGNIANHLGGRTEDNFGHVDARLKDIGPGKSVTLEDVVKTAWGENIKGALLVFAYKAGTFSTTTTPGGEPRDVVVTSHTYDLGTTTDNKPTTYGQGIPGIPWYFYLDPSQQAKGLDHAVFTGIREDASFRTAVGVVNISDPMTTLEVHFTLTKDDGTALKDTVELLPPLAHVQWDNAAHTLFALASDQTVAGATLKVAVQAWDSTANAPTPALIAYVSRIDNTTNDPVYLEQSFEKELPWDCVFNGHCTAATALSSPGQALHRRPLRPPMR